MAGRDAVGSASTRWADYSQVDMLGLRLIDSERVPREQKMLKRHLPRVNFDQAYQYTEEKHVISPLKRVRAVQIDCDSAVEYQGVRGGCRHGARLRATMEQSQ